jgi:hypothetical protein
VTTGALLGRPLNTPGEGAVNEPGLVDESGAERDAREPRSALPESDENLRSASPGSIHGRTGSRSRHSTETLAPRLGSVFTCRRAPPPLCRRDHARARSLHLANREVELPPLAGSTMLRVRLFDERTERCAPKHAIQMPFYAASRMQLPMSVRAELAGPSKREA